MGIWSTGTATAVSDYLRRHIAAIGNAQAAGVDVRGYFAWGLFDNCEWELGCGQRFGLIRVDYQTLARTVKDSGWWYRDFLRERLRSGA